MYHFDENHIYNPHPVNRRIILFVDDDEDQLLIYRFLCKNIKYDFEFLTFTSPENAINYIKQFYKKSPYSDIQKSEEINLIVSDFYMYPKNGIEFFKELMESGFKIPFVLLSSFITDSIKEKAKNLGIKECIEKKLSATDIINKLTVYML